MKTLVILAAGMGKRFNGGIKQLERVYNGKTIMELSIINAKRAGFNKVIFIIREELKELFDKNVIPNIDIDYGYVYQTIDSNRLKPWGTGEAIINLKGIVKDSFCLINSDDYYTYDAFKKISKDVNSTVLYKLKNTLITNSIVNRGICLVNNDFLVNIEETIGIDINNGYTGDELVSMNIWGLDSNIISLFEEEFINFKKSIKDVENSEFMIPSVINKLINDKKIKIHVSITDDKCFGITFNSDIEKFREYIKNDNN